MIRAVAELFVLRLRYLLHLFMHTVSRTPTCTKPGRIRPSKHHRLTTPYSLLGVGISRSVRTSESTDVRRFVWDGSGVNLSAQRQIRVPEKTTL